jgi:hypothetical protein
MRLTCDPIRPAPGGGARTGVKSSTLVMIAMLALTACGGERGSDEPVPAEGAELGAERQTEPDAPPPAAEAVAPPDSAAIARALDEDDALEAENRATFRARQRSMASYDECMAAARGLPPEPRARVEAACAARREAP